MRQSRIENLIREVRQLKRRYRQSSPTERPSVEGHCAHTAEISAEGRKHKEKARKKTKKRIAFIVNPYQFASNLLDKEHSGTLETPVEEVERYLHETHSDPSRKVALGDYECIEPAAPPGTELLTSELTHAEVKEVIKKARFGSAPGPNAIPYKVYNMCPLLQNRLILK